MSYQPPIPGLDHGALAAVVNVASVHHYSPFRYPGGKTWLVPRIHAWLASLPSRPSLFIEPFAGGAIVALTVAAERLADHVVMVELDADVAAVWQTILSPANEQLAESILGFQLTPESLDEIESSQPASLFERAFQTLIRNRTYHGGILASGSGRIKRGENGKGLLSRWYPQTLARRIRAIAAFADRIQFIHGDCLAQLERHASDLGAVAFVDPPYTAAGKRAGRRLYTHADLDHDRLFSVMSRFRGDFLMTYDVSAELEALCLQHRFQFTRVAMSNTHHARMNELLIGRDLSWCTAPPSA